METTDLTPEDFEDIPSLPTEDEIVARLDAIDPLPNGKSWRDFPCIDPLEREQKRIERLKSWAPECVALKDRHSEHWKLAMELAAVRAGLPAYKHRSQHFE